MSKELKNKLIYLTGFMASGKSTIGPILANTIGWDFLDLDKVIEESSGKTIKKIFIENGEEFFRALETKHLTDISKYSKHIISLGGGTIATEENLKIIKSSGLLIYLESSPEETYKRLRFKRDRPALLFDGDDEPTKEKFLNKINYLLSNRIKYYNLADYKINTDKFSVGSTVDRIAAIIKKELYGKTNKS